ncbi:hypothetical protein [Lysinibacillus fusiformis]|uniref:hypothetical protein n=1 Tax=Lysinibacillus fusiformis TaxID=28031 RepID=UPI0018805E48|nr:hypothetical protein [Lysinibacillus fusiformis]MBD8523831.1 hypothetical protein [Lysinibacillus fusiformis]
MVNINPTTITKCYFTEDISGGISLNRKDLTADMCPSDAEHYYRINVYGMFYPVFPRIQRARQQVGYFLSSDYNEYICVFVENSKYIVDESIGELGWLPYEK